MFSLLQLFWRLHWPICQLQRGPQDLPAAPALLRFAMLACFLSGVLVFTLSVSVADAMLRTGFSLAISLLIWPLLLHAAGQQARLLQTLTAVLGCAAILNFLLWPLSWLIRSLGDRAGLLPLLLIALLLWSVTVSGHILRHALDWPLPRALALAVLLFALRYGLYQLIFA
ncbi:hypothetical protein HPT27_06560 [Permianibacter sp. IMCC34836]|uniref:hypothetical protein n=1 Tax=Permianibacter fluminis TaxID=2738515 RepID=UPI001556AB18|nr:hypothetical protein [Permianibacter fluminis]NQD36681.1 hypothetical protein [Permianibacter fluminis]